MGLYYQSFSPPPPGVAPGFPFALIICFSGTAATVAQFVIAGTLGGVLGTLGFWLMPKAFEPKGLFSLLGAFLGALLGTSIAAGWIRSGTVLVRRVVKHFALHSSR
jgi:hypothetical protein